MFRIDKKVLSNFHFELRRFFVILVWLYKIFGHIDARTAKKINVLPSIDYAWQNDNTVSNPVNSYNMTEIGKEREITVKIEEPKLRYSNQK